MSMNLERAFRVKGECATGHGVKHLEPIPSDVLTPPQLVWRSYYGLLDSRHNLRRPTLLSSLPRATIYRERPGADVSALPEI